MGTHMQQLGKCEEGLTSTFSETRVRSPAAWKGGRCCRMEELWRYEMLIREKGQDTAQTVEDSHRAARRAP